MLKTISTQELRVKLDRGDDVKLIMAMSRQAYDWLHIPGSLHFDSVAQTAQRLRPDDEIVVYCSNPMCFASRQVYHALRRKGFKGVRHYLGGLEAWQAAGLPLEGRLA